MSHVFPRVARELPRAVAAEGAWITDADGRRYLDAAGGAVVVGVGHGDRSLIEAAERQLARTQYVHGSMFTTESLEDYADALAPLLPMDAARIYPVSGGSEAVETAIKMVRAYHLAIGQGGRSTIIARRSSYHGNTLGALDLSGKEPLRKPYTPWLGRFLHAPPAYEYRCENPRHPDGCGAWHADELERMIESYGPDTIAAFIAEPVAGATLAAAVPCEDYWPKIVEVCRRFGVLVIADEVMTGFGHPPPPPPLLRGFVRRVRRYYGTVRLPTPVHPRVPPRRSLGVPPADHADGRARDLPVLAHEGSVHALVL